MEERQACINNRLVLPARSSVNGIPLHPEVTHLTELLSAIVSRAASLSTRDNQDIFITGHLKQFLCYGYQLLVDPSIREYWGEFRDISFDDLGVCRINILLHQATSLTPEGVVRIGQVRSVHEISRNGLGQPINYFVAGQTT